MIAETMLGNGDRAYEYYSQINPAGKNDIIDLYEIEPYVYAQNILGDEHPQFGLGRNSWLSGTASWCIRQAHNGSLVSARNTMVCASIHAFRRSGMASKRRANIAASPITSR